MDDRICANAPDYENANLEAIEATLDHNFVPEGWLDPLTQEEAQAIAKQEEKRHLCPRVVLCVQWQHPFSRFFQFFLGKWSSKCRATGFRCG